MNRSLIVSKKVFSVLTVLATVLMPFASYVPVAGAITDPTPSTNAINITNGWANVQQLSQGVGTTALKFTSTRRFVSCFEYRTDGDTTQQTSSTNYNSAITDGLYPYYCQNNSSSTHTIAANEYVEVRMVFGAEKDERFDWTRFNVLTAPDMVAVKSSSVEGTIQTGQPFSWTIRVQNNGGGDAVYGKNASIFEDHLPFTNLADYSTPIVTSSGLVGASNIECVISGLHNLDCDVVNVNGASVTFPAGAYFDVTVSTNSTAAGTYTNPRPGVSNICQVYSQHFTESNEDNNSCNSSAVTVIAPTPTPTPVPTCSATSYFDNFALLSVDGQYGWKSTGAYDQEIVPNTYGYPTFGCQSLRLSNAVTTGAFGDQTFSFSTTNEAGEVDSTNGGQSSGTRQRHFEAQFDIGSAQRAQQSGLAISVSPDRGDGSRQSYLRFVDDVSGIDVFFDDVQGTGSPANFVETQVADNLSRADAHTIKFVIDYVDGPSNDVVKIYIDGNLVKTGTTWENYYRYDAESIAEQTPRTTDSLIFRAAGTAVPATDGKGFVFDNVALSSSIPLESPTPTPTPTPTPDLPLCSDEKPATLVETVPVSATNTAQVSSVATLTSGSPYILRAHGTWTNGRGTVEPVIEWVDSEYISKDVLWSTPMDGDPAWTGSYGVTPYQDDLELWVNNAAVNWGTYSLTHQYDLAFSGLGAPVSFRIFDGSPNTGEPTSAWYADNSDGDVAVDVYSCARVPVEPQCGTELVKNGSFEQPEVTENALWEIFSTVPDWAVAWSSSVTGAPDAAFLELHEGVNGWTAQEGDQHVEMDTDWYGPSGSVDGEQASVIVSQNIPTTPNAKYTVSFWTSPRPGTGVTENATKFSWGGSPVATIIEDGSANSTTVWTKHTYELTALGSVTTLSFEDMGIPNSLGGFLDNVSVKKVCDEVPATGQITLRKTVVGGTATAANFTPFINGEQVSWDIAYPYPAPASYAVSETGGVPGETYTASYDNTFCPGGNVSLVGGGTMVCDITNTIATTNVKVCKVDEDNQPQSDWQVMLLGEKAASIDVLPNGTSYTTSSIASGSYVLIASGSYIYRPNSAGDIADAAFSRRIPGDASYYVDGALVAYEPWANGNDFKADWLGFLSILVDTPTSTGTHGWGSVYNSTHRYAQAYSTPGSPVSFKILDSAYGDNSGKLSVNIYRGYLGTTGVDGCATFANVPVGNYTTDEIMQDGWAYVSGVGQVAVDGLQGDTFTIKNDGPDAPTYSEVTGMKFNDENGDGNQDEGEDGLEGWEICLTPVQNDRYSLQVSTEKPIEKNCVITDENGDYTFLNVPAGDYQLSETQKQGWEQTAPEGGTYFVSFPTGERITGKNFGNHHLPQCSNGIDDDRDDRDDSNDPGCTDKDDDDERDPVSNSSVGSDNPGGTCFGERCFGGVGGFNPEEESATPPAESSRPERGTGPTIAQAGIEGETLGGLADAASPSASPEVATTDDTNNQVAAAGVILGLDMCSPAGNIIWWITLLVIAVVLLWFGRRRGMMLWFTLAYVVIWALWGLWLCDFRFWWLSIVLGIIIWLLSAPRNDSQDR